MNSTRRRRTTLATALLGSGLVLGGLTVPAEAAPKPLKASVRATTVEEGTGGAVVARVPIVLNRKAGRRVVVRWRTGAGTAKPGEDFRGARGKLVIRKGSKRAVARVRIIGDDVVEETERLRVRITKVRGAKVGKRVARVRILDDDTSPLVPGGPDLPDLPDLPGVDGLPLLQLGGFLPTFLDVLGGDSLPVPLSLDEVAPTDVTGVLTGSFSTLAGDLPLPSVPFTIPKGSLAPETFPTLSLLSLPVGADALTLSITELTGARAGDLTRTLPVVDSTTWPTLTMGSLPGSLAGLLNGGSLPIPLTLDEPALTEVTGVLVTSITGLGGSTVLSSVPFTIPQGATGPLGGLAVPLSLVSLPLGSTGLTTTVTQLTGAVPGGLLSGSVPLL